MKLFYFLAKIIITFIIFYYLFKNEHLFIFDLKNSFKNIYFTSFLCCLSFITILLNAERWKIILNSLKFKISFIESFKLIYIGNFFNTIFLGAYGGDIIKGYYISKSVKEKKIIAISSILFDRVFGLLGLIIISFICYFFLFFENIKINFFLIILIFLILFLIFIYFQIKNKFLEIKNKINIFSISSIIRCVLLSIFLFFFVNLNVYFISKYVFTNHINIFEIFLSNSLATFANAVPLTPGGIGLGEITFVKVNIIFLENSIKNLANTIIYFRIINFITSIPGLFLYLFYKRKYLEKI